MSTQSEIEQERRAELRASGFKIWHLTILVAFVALAIREIQVERVTDPVLVAIAAGGFALYGVLAWLGWRLAEKSKLKVSRVTRLGLYFTSMAGLFFIATVVYLGIEHVYRGGRF